MAKKKRCFVIAPIGEQGSEIRKRSDQVFNYIIRPVLERLGYEPERADQMATPGIITNQVIQAVLEFPLVIADLTWHRANVFYELAIRHVVRKPFIQMIEVGQEIPFDVRATRTIIVNTKDLDSVEEAKRELENQVKSIDEGAAETENPISVAFDLQALRGSKEPEERSLAHVLEAISELRAEIRALQRRMSVPRIDVGLESTGTYRVPSFYTPTSYQGPVGPTGPSALDLYSTGIRTTMPSMVFVDPATRRELSETIDLLSSIEKGDGEEWPEIDEAKRKLTSLRSKMLTLGE